MQRLSAQPHLFNNQLLSYKEWEMLCEVAKLFRAPMTYIRNTKIRTKRFVRARYAVVYVARFLLKLSYREIAIALSLPLSTIKSICARYKDVLDENSFEMLYLWAEERFDE